MTGPIPDKPGPRCNEGAETGPDDLGRCALPLGHDGMHTPLFVLWQMAGYAYGPWHPDSSASQRVRDVIAANPDAAAELEQWRKERPVSAG